MFTLCAIEGLLANNLWEGYEDLAISNSVFAARIMFDLICKRLGWQF